MRLWVLMCSYVYGSYLFLDYSLFFSFSKPLASNFSLGDWHGWQNGVVMCPSTSRVKGLSPASVLCVWSSHVLPVGFLWSALISFKDTKIRLNVFSEIAHYVSESVYAYAPHPECTPWDNLPASHDSPQDKQCSDREWLILTIKVLPYFRLQAVASLLPTLFFTSFWYNLIFVLSVR